MKEKLEAEKAWKTLVDAYRAAAATYEETPGLVEKALRERRRTTALSDIQAALLQFKETDLVKKSNGALESTVTTLAKAYHVIIKNDETQKVYKGLYDKELSKLTDPVVDLTFRAASTFSVQSLESYYQEIKARKLQSTATEGLTVLAEIQPPELRQKLQEKYYKLAESLKPEMMPNHFDVKTWVNHLKDPTLSFGDYHRELAKASVGIQLLFGVSQDEYKSAQEAVVPKNTSPLRRGG